MKKLLIILLCFTMIPAITVFGAFDVVEADYEYTINNDHWFNLATGVYEYNVDYNTTNRIAIKYDSINLDNVTSFHHLLFFKNNEYLGYYNSQITTYIVPETFLGVLNTFTPSIPTGATHFVVVDYNNYKNLVPKEELNNHTLKQIFENNLLTVTPTYTNLTNTSYQNYNLIGSASTVSGEHYTDFHHDSKPINGNDVIYAYSTIKNVLGKYRMQIYMFNGTTFELFQGALVETLINTSIQLNVISTYTQGSGFIYRHRLTNELGESVYVGSNEYYNLSNIGFINQTTFGISSLTKTQMDSYYDLYRSNLASDVYYQHYRNLTDNPPPVSYIYEKPIPDDTPPLDKIDNFLDDLGIGTKGFKLFISIAVIAITMILLVMGFKAQALIVIIAASLELVLFVFMGWIPNYVIIVLAVLLFILIIKERSGNNEA